METMSLAVQADDVELYAPTTETIAAKSLLHLVFYARSAGAGNATFDAVVRSASTPGMESFRLATTVSGDWVRFSHAFTSLDDYEPAEAQVVFQLGYGAQAIEIGGLDIRQYGPPLQMEEPPLHTFTGFGHTRRVVSIAPGQPFGKQALHVTLTESKANSWEAQLYPTPMIYPDLHVDSSDVFFVSFYARQISSDSDMGARMTSVVERYSDYQKPLSFGVIMDTNWRQYFVPFTAGMTVEPGDFKAALFVGYEPQVFEIAQMQWYYYGGLLNEHTLPAQAYLDYPGRESDAHWRPAAASRIEQYRKVDLEVEVRDANGLPLPGATVDINMTRHDYGFGMAASYWLIDDQGPAGAAYREKLLTICNCVANHNCFKMPAWNGDWGSNYDRDVTLRALQWLKDNDFYVRGHVMVWPSYTHISSQARTLWDNRQNAALEQYVLNHIQSVASETKGYVDEWDVINEPYDNHDLMDRFGDSVMIDWFDKARSILPSVPLFINDYSILATGGETDTAHQQRLYDIIEYLQDNQASLNGIGIQAHFGRASDLTPPNILVKILDRFSTFNLPIEITEFTLKFYNEQVEADYMQDFMTVIFSHPSTVGIVQWDFWPLGDWPNHEHLYRLDGSIKPKGQAYLDLVYNTWWTRAHGITNASGRFTAPDRAFKGTYQIQASYGEHSAVLEDVEVVLDKSDANRVIVTLALE
ncbi:MAG: endo-1,4-beta-xylanase [Phycisphaerales bacterium]|nr:MAG: endo-1,4-beta-xylanase [Phycisphaerales bacterium]